MKSPKPYENPLILHIRMRGLYRAVLEARLLPRRGEGWPRGLEACWAATALDLREGDLTSDSHAPWLTSYVRALGSRKNARAATLSDVRTAKSNRGSMTAFQATASERLFIAVGQAMALRAAGQGVVLTYVATDALKKSAWHSLLAATTGHSLPLVIVAVPGDKDVQLPNLQIPIIPVDAGDPVALYRVAQESILRARTHGALAIIQCVRCGVDPVQLLATQLLHKGICTERWLTTAETGFRTLLASA